MVFDVSKITGIDPHELVSEPSPTPGQPGRSIYTKDNKAFLIVNKNTLEIRCDPQLISNLKAKYESVMESRYFGRGGIEIVLAGQLSQSELADLIRHSYQITA